MISAPRETLLGEVRKASNLPDELCEPSLESAHVFGEASFRKSGRMASLARVR